jgi:hypothetical protein
MTLDDDDDDDDILSAFDVVSSLQVYDKNYASISYQSQACCMPRPSPSPFI